MKLPYLMIIIFAFAIFISGCVQTDKDSSGSSEPTICVPVSEIAKICEHIDPPQINEDNNANDTVIEDIEAVNEVINEVNESIVKEEEIIIDADYIIAEGELLVISPKATDPDNDILKFEYSQPLNASGKWQTNPGDAGIYYVNITASDGINSVVKNAVILVNKKDNFSPVLDDIADITVNAGELVNLSINAYDPDEDEITINISSPLEMGFWETSSENIGEHEVNVTVSDGLNTISKTFKVIVVKTNNPPAIKSLTAAQVNEGELLQVNLIAEDLDNDSLIISYGYPLDENGQWQTQAGDAGDYQVSITISDGYLTDTKNISLTVNAVNQPPVIEGLLDMAINETDTLILSPQVSDPENDNITISISEPVGNDGLWETTYDDAGEYNITVSANDGTNIKTEYVLVTVLNKNRPPVFEI